MAMTVLSILAATFATFFGWNITSIFEAGEKTKAIAKAEKKLERLYYSMDDYETDAEYVSCVNVETKDPSRNRNFCVVEKTYINGNVEGYNVTVVVFYQNGERHVSISAFIEAGQEGG